MHRRFARIVRYGALLAALALLVVAGSALASPGHKAAAAKAKVHHAKHAAVKKAAESPAPETGGAPESAADDAAQAAACQKAGIDPNGNVQFDDATGTCSLDTGGQSGN